MKKSIRISGLLSALLLVYGGAQAAGLGKLSVLSALGQPLRAEIELVSVTKDELSGINAQLAGGEIFRQARVERSSALGALQFSVEQRTNGQPIVRITSSAPMSEPFLDMLIELNWSTGRIIREYTILLDPPAEARAAKPEPIKAASTATAAREPAPVEATRPAPEAAKPAAKPAPAPKPEVTRYGPVKPGETLRSVAGRVRSGEVTLEQMMAGLYLTNKSSFIDGNMNLLKKGAVLNVPTAESVHLKTSPAQAVRMVREHLDQWHAYRGKVAETAGEMPESRAAAPAAGKITPRVEDRAGAAPAPKDVLKLSKGEPASGKPDAKTQERLQSLEEELAAKSRALQEAQDRVSQLERAVQDMQKLLELKSQQGAAPTPPAPEAAPPAPPPQPEAAPPAEPAAAPAPVPAPPAPVEDDSSWIGTFLRNPIYIGGLVAAGLLSGLLWMMMAGSRRRQGLNKFEDSIMTGGEFKSGAVFNTAGAAAGTAAAPSNTEGSMLLTDFSRLGLGAIDTHEVDPIAEAEVYMAYGRDSQAEEILKEALDKDSSRHEIALKLLEIYAARKDPLAFETTASELYAGLGGQDTPVWQRAAEMGRSIDPENPLYRMAQGQPLAAEAEAPAVAPAPEPVPQAAAEADDLSLDFTPSAAPAAAPVAEPEPVAASDEGLEFTSEFRAATPAIEETAPVEEEVVLEFEPTALEFEVEAKEEPAPELEMPAEFAMPEALPEVAEIEEVAEFTAPEMEVPESLPEALPEAESLELTAPAMEVVEEVAEPLPELDLSSIDLDLVPEPASEAVIEEVAAPSLDFETELEAAAAPAEAPAPGIDPALWEEVNTKLDLARAYLEMGDREGAREILQEVAQEGDAAQQSEANKLLAEAG